MAAGFSQSDNETNKEETSCDAMDETIGNVLLGVRVMFTMTMMADDCCYTSSSSSLLLLLFLLFLLFLLLL